MILEPLRLSHFNMIELQERQLMFNDLLLDKDYKQQLLQHDGYALVNGLDCYIMAGVIDVYYGRGIAWCLLSKLAKKNMLACTRAVTNYLADADFKRIETTVEADFTEGERWAKMLGFTKECEMKNYCDGKTHYLYARYK